MKIFKELQEKYLKKEKEKDLINKRESTMHNLLVELSTEESIEVFNQVSVLFYSAMEKRLKEVREEKTNLEKFLNNEDAKN